MSCKLYFRFSSRSSFNSLDFDDEISLGLEKRRKFSACEILT